MYLVACCGMCTFGALEPVTGANTTTFALTVMKIQHHCELCHTIILNKDSMFYGVLRESLTLLKINCHVLSGDNHNPVLVERLCRYFNKGLCIMTNERDTVRVALESLLLLLYAWNLCPVPGTECHGAWWQWAESLCFQLTTHTASIGSLRPSQQRLTHIQSN
jgi:hypothetical protein